MIEEIEQLILQYEGAIDCEDKVSKLRSLLKRAQANPSSIKAMAIAAELEAVKSSLPKLTVEPRHRQSVQRIKAVVGFGGSESPSTSRPKSQLEIEKEAMIAARIENERKTVESRLKKVDGECFEDTHMLEADTGSEQWPVAALGTYRPGSATEIPGTKFSDICPSQKHVNRRVVEDKLRKGIPGTPVVPVKIDAKEQVVLLDKHHLFVASMALGRPVKLAFIREDSAVTGYDDWTQCTWKGFDKPKEGAADTGFKAGDLEDEVVVDDGWKRLVPWRRDEPEDATAKAEKVMDAFNVRGPKTDLTDQLKAACGDDPSLASMLYETVNIGMINVQIREKPEKSTGGDWDADNNTIYIDDDLSPLDAIDMLVFEAFNAKNQPKFFELDHRAYDERMNSSEYGIAKAAIEAETEIEYLEHLLARRTQESVISGNGQGHLDKIDAKFVEKRLPPYSTMTPEERRDSKPRIIEIFCDTPHNAKAALPDRNALKSSDLYAYEKVADRQNVKGIYGYFRDIIPRKKTRNDDKVEPFLRVLKSVRDCRLGTPPRSWAGAFYEVVSEEANRVFGMTEPVLNGEQKQVAAHEYRETGGTFLESLRSQLAAISSA